MESCYVLLIRSLRYGFPLEKWPLMHTSDELISSVMLFFLRGNLPAPMIQPDLPQLGFLSLAVPLHGAAR